MFQCLIKLSKIKNLNQTLKSADEQILCSSTKRLSISILLFNNEKKNSLTNWICF